MRCWAAAKSAILVLLPAVHAAIAMRVDFEMLTIWHCARLAQSQPKPKDRGSNSRQELHQIGPSLFQLSPTSPGTSRIPSVKASSHSHCSLPPSFGVRDGTEYCLLVTDLQRSTNPFITSSLHGNDQMNHVLPPTSNDTKHLTDAHNIESPSCASSMFLASSISSTGCAAHIKHRNVQ